MYWFVYVKEEAGNWITSQKLWERSNKYISKILKNLPSNGSAWKSPIINVSSKGYSIIKFEASCKFDWNSWSEMRDESSQQMFTLSTTKKCNNVRTSEHIILFMIIIAKKLMMSVLFQFKAKPSSRLPSLRRPTRQNKKKSSLFVRFWWKFAHICKVEYKRG